jgi:hypothetical protein
VSLYQCISVVAVCAVTFMALNAWMKADANETVREFMRKFPGRCLICSLHRYGFMHGFEKSRYPQKHDCIEAGELESKQP